MSLRELFVGLTAAAVFFWCVAQAGVGNGIFWFATVVGAVMTSVWWLAARQQGARVLAPLVPLVFGFFCGMMIASQALVWLGLFLIVAGVVCPIVGVFVGHPLRAKTLAMVATACWLAALVMGGVAGRRGGQELELARAQNPIVSLAPRLAYEQAKVRNSAAFQPASLAGSVDAALRGTEELEDEVRDEYYGRTWTLQELHERRFDDFIRAAGFGVGRMTYPRPRRIERPELVDIAFGETLKPSEVEWYADWHSVSRQQRGRGPGQLHLSSRDDFLTPESFGWIKTRLEEVAGFVPHAFHDAVREEEKPPKWEVERLELVSLLKFDMPRVYVLDHLPRMDQLSGDNVPTRELDEFERRALQQLRTRDDFVVESAGDATRMLGSLRAGRTCLECHSVQRGELLGAFSYVLAGGARGEVRGARGGDVLAGE